MSLESESAPEEAERDPADEPPGHHPDPDPAELEPQDPGEQPDPAGEPPGHDPDPDPDEL